MSAEEMSAKSKHVFPWRKRAINLNGLPHVVHQLMVPTRLLFRASTHLLSARKTCRRGWEALVERMGQRMEQWRGDPYRRESNAISVHCDGVGHLLSALLLTVYLCAKLAAEGSWGLTLLGSTHVALAAGLAAMCCRRQRAYVARRELLASGAALHLAFLVRAFSTYGPLNMFERHGGSPSRLLGLFLLSSHTVWMSLYILWGRLQLVSTCLVLPGLILLPLLVGRSPCCRLLAAAGVEAPLADLYGTLSIVHSAAVSPTIRAAASIPPDPAQQCRALDSWLGATLGFIAPLLLVHRLERQARARFAARHRLAQAQAGVPPRRRPPPLAHLTRRQLEAAVAGTQLSQAAAEPHSTPGADVGEASLPALMGHVSEALEDGGCAWMELYLLSCLSWVAASALPRQAAC